MCGIVGYIAQNDGAFENARRGFLRYALMLDTLRGADSTGVITIKNKFTVKNFKSTSSGFKFATSDGFKDKVPNGWATIGHNRSATIGDVSVDNAHPFRFGPISMVHNGTLRRDGMNFPSYDKTFEVDSMQIAFALSKVPVKKAQEVLEAIDGDFAIVWTDTRDRSINMARNFARPMHIAFNYARTLLFFMSDGDHLSVLLKGFQGTSASCGTIYKLDAMQHLKWKKGSIRPIEVTEFGPFTVEVKKGREVQHRTTPIGMHPSAPTEIIHPRTPGAKSPTSLAVVKSTERQPQKNGLIIGANARSGSSSTESKGDGPREMINKIATVNRKIIEGMPKHTTTGHLEAMKNWLEVVPNDLIQFTPEDSYCLGSRHKLQQVVGSVNLVHWMDTPWSCTINFVPDSLWDEYNDRDWLVRPIGLTRNRESDGIPGLLADLVHCNWKQYVELLDKEESEKKPVKKPGKVFDPAGRLVTPEELERLYDHGCISCAAAMDPNDKNLHIMVNDRRDVLCEICQWDQQWPELN